MYKKVPVAAIAVFYVIAVVMRYLATKTDLSAHLGNPFLQTMFRGSGPAVGAIVVSLLFGIKIPLTFKGKFSNLLTPLTLYWLLPVAVLLTYSLFISTDRSLTPIFSLLVYALLEETGWRGFLRPALSSLPKFTNILIVTVLWFIWHLDIAFSAGHLVFFLILLLGSWGIGIVADKTGSLLAVAAFHSLNNIYAKAEVHSPLLITLLAALFVVWLASVLMMGRKKESSDNKAISL